MKQEAWMDTVLAVWFHIAVTVSHTVIVLLIYLLESASEISSFWGRVQWVIEKGIAKSTKIQREKWHCNLRRSAYDSQVEITVAEPVRNHSLKEIAQVIKFGRGWHFEDQFELVASWGLLLFQENQKQSRTLHKYIRVMCLVPWLHMPWGWLA